MSLNLARLGTIQRRATSDFDPFAEAEARRRAQRDEKKFARDEEVAALNLARLKKDEADAARLEQEQGQEREVLGRYIQGRDFAQTAPIGVVNPRFLGKQEFGPQVEGGAPRDTSSVEREAVLNLAKINPVKADEFETGLRTRRESAEDRARRIAGEDRTAKLEGDKFAWTRDKDTRTMTETERSNRADEYIRSLTAKNQTFKPTPGQAAVDREFAKDIVAWSMGGASAVQKDLKQLEGVLEEIAPKNKDGVRKGKAGISGPGVSMVPDAIKPYVGLSKAVDVQERVQEVAQKNLREILGGQFAMKEGEQLVARAYNPRLKPEVNAERIERILPQMKAAAAAKEEAAQYFLANGTLAGYDLSRLQKGMGELKGAIEGLDKAPQGAGGSEYEEYLRLKELAGQ